MEPVHQAPDDGQVIREETLGFLLDQGFPIGKRPFVEIGHGVPAPSRLLGCVACRCGLLTYTARAGA